MHTFVARLSLTVTLLLWVATSATAQNWPAFRGPNGSGIASAPLPTAWDGEKSGNILWKTPLPGLGHSSPVVWGDRVFVTLAISSADNPNHNPKKRHVKATQANATPVTDGHVVVVSFGSEGLYAYDFAGTLLWKQDLGILDPGYAGQPELSWGFATSPVIYQGLVILQCDIQTGSFIVAFNLKDGSRAWRTERDEIPSWSTPVIYRGKTRTELVTSGSNYYRGYDPLTGKELWRLRDGSQVKVPSPVIANDLFYLTGGNPRGREFYVMRPNASGDVSLSLDQESSASVAWRKQKGSPYTPTPIVYDGHLYVVNDNGVLTVYDATTGEQRYQNRIGTTNSTFSASPIAAAGRVYFASEDGEVFVVKAGSVYELLATNRMGEPLMATPAAADGVLLIRGQRHLFAVVGS
jgi:outer membrane protein assembly factor BamB